MTLWNMSPPAVLPPKPNKVSLYYNIISTSFLGTDWHLQKAVSFYVIHVSRSTNKKIMKWWHVGSWLRQSLIAVSLWLSTGSSDIGQFHMMMVIGWLPWMLPLCLRVSFILFTEVAVKRGSIIYHLAYWFMARWNSIMDVEIVSVDSVQGCLIWQWSTVSRLTVVKGVSVDSDQGCLSWQWSMVSRLTMVKVVSVNSGQGCLSWQWSTVSRLTMVKGVWVDNGQGCLGWQWSRVS